MPASRTLSMGCGPTEVEFLPSVGGRLSSLRYNGVPLVLPPGRVPGFHGDTFWPSPQARFDWPPPPILDAAAYEVVTESPLGLILRSAPDPDFGFQVEKCFELAEHGLAMQFTLTNIWSRPQDVAPWQVTRAPREGLLVWATGDPFHDADRLAKQAEDPGCWFVHRDSTTVFPGLEAAAAHSSIAVPAVSATSKLFTDARGWLAHAHDATLFLRTFPDLTLDQAAPRQGELELYFNPERDYIELENQGAYVTLAPGESLTYPVEWRFRALDPGLRTDRLTPELLAEIDALLAAGATTLRPPE
ncbi:MAG TPA: DUF4380 domain-containing protein [Dermatophilaceae bacterium]|nr:DUF4380 domain-containing protein [Dermatophilaceae bacterium]